MYFNHCFFWNFNGKTFGFSTRYKKLWKTINTENAKKIEIYCPQKKGNEYTSC
jgi:hypothetical protein